ncbi:hypothetical protein CPB85DRAFT_191740 [Mucidula mucida]|nr:hypothetical protein CPB85DRAFT_191740 [Mucidula mucida]
MDPPSTMTLFNFVLKCTGNGAPSFSFKTSLNMRITHHDMTFDLAEMPFTEGNADRMYALNIALTLLQATGMLIMTISQALEDDTEIKLGTTSLDLGHLRDSNKDEEHTYDLFMDSVDLFSMQVMLMAGPSQVAFDHVQCSHVQHVKRFLVVEAYSEDTTDADFIRYGAELKELAQTQHVLLVMSQFLNLRDRCLAVANVHDQLSLIALFAELLDEEFRRRKRRSTDLHVFPLSVSRFRRRVMEADRLRSLSFPRFPPRHNRDIYEYVSTFIRDVPPSKLALWPS